MLTLSPDKGDIFVDVHNGGGVKANVDACGQGGGGQILLKLCGCHKWMPPTPCLHVACVSRFNVPLDM